MRMQYIISHRVNPITHRGYLLVAHTGFSGNGTERGTGAYSLISSERH